MTRTTVVLAAFVAALGASAAAAAKGPSSATLQGPGLDHAPALTGNGEPGGGTTLGRIADLSGFYPAVFGQEPPATTRARPAGARGPRFTIRYTVPGPNARESVIRQDVYPYAKPFPITHVPPGQPFFGSEHTIGGWYVAPPALRQVLAEAGLPASAPSAGGSPIDASLVAGLAAGTAAIVLLVLAVLRHRRRLRAAPA